MQFLMVIQTKADQERGHMTEKTKKFLKTNSCQKLKKIIIMMQHNIVKVGQQHKLTAFIQVRHIKYDWMNLNTPSKGRHSSVTFVGCDLY